MDWLKNNPFLGGLAIGTAALTGAALYFAMGARQELDLQKEEFTSLMGQLSSVQSNKPFPNQANLNLASAELEQAQKILSELSSKVAEQSAPLNPQLTPQQFQDALNTTVAKIAATAAKNSVTLPENFYLGFDQYRAQPPTPSASPQLGQQLQSIAEAVNILLASKVSSITSIVRPPLPVESQDNAEEKDKSNAQLFLAPFDVEFVADQANFRQSMEAIIRAKPLLFIRALEVRNSNPKSPTKSNGLPHAPNSGAAPDDSDSVDNGARLPVIFGQEQLTVRIRLSSIATFNNPRSDS